MAAGGSPNGARRDADAMFDEMPHRTAPQRTGRRGIKNSSPRLQLQVLYSGSGVR